MSDSTRDTSEAVRQIIERDAVIRKGLARGLINTRALARYIRRLEHDAYSMEALVSAIRRYPVRATSAKHEDIGGQITKLSLKNKIVAVTLKNAPEIPNLLAKFSGEIDTARGENLQIVSGVDFVTVFLDSKNLGKLTADMPRHSIVSTLHGLAVITVALSPAGLKTLGIVGAFGTELAMNDVNIFYTLSYGDPSSMLFVTEESDGLKAYQALERLAKGGA